MTGIPIGRGHGLLRRGRRSHGRGGRSGSGLVAGGRCRGQRRRAGAGLTAPAQQQPDDHHADDHQDPGPPRDDAAVVVVAFGLALGRVLGRPGGLRALGLLALGGLGPDGRDDALALGGLGAGRRGRRGILGRLVGRPVEVPPADLAGDRRPGRDRLAAQAPHLVLRAWLTLGQGARGVQFAGRVGAVAPLDHLLPPATTEHAGGERVEATQGTGLVPGAELGPAGRAGPRDGAGGLLGLSFGGGLGFGFGGGLGLGLGFRFGVGLGFRLSVGLGFRLGVGLGFRLGFGLGRVQARGGGLHPHAGRRRGAVGGVVGAGRLGGGPAPLARGGGSLGIGRVGVRGGGGLGHVFGTHNSASFLLKTVKG